MADIGHGIYLSRIDTEEWEPDDEVGGAAHMLFDESDVSKVGLWRADEGGPRGPSDPVGLPARETIVVLEGAVRVGRRRNHRPRPRSRRHGLEPKGRASCGTPTPAAR